MEYRSRDLEELRPPMTHGHTRPEGIHLGNIY